MALSVAQKVILAGSPFAWVHRIESGAIADEWLFDNLQSSNIKLLKAGSESAAGENIDINRADGAIWRFNKTSKILDGVTEDDITPADASDTATKKGEITLLINEAPNELNSWTAFIDELKTYQDSFWFVTIGSGFSHKARTTDKKPEGYYQMIGKISNDIEQALANAPTTLSLTFASDSGSELDEDELTSGTLYSAMTWKLGNGKDVTGIKPPTITSGEETIILAGDVNIVTDITYS